MILKKEIIIIDNKNVTNNISSYKYDKYSNTYMIKYKNSNKYYCYSSYRVSIIKEMDLINKDNYYFYLDNKLLYNIKEIYQFEGKSCLYYYVIFNNNSTLIYDNFRLKKINKDSSNNIIKYMKNVSKIISISLENNKKILYEQMNKIKVNNLDTALANYLKLSNNLLRENNVELLIFPFGCNSSQYDAVRNAIYNKISIVEGPPGTGKTQTILNIIANIIIRNMNCQVVSNNNSAIENIEEKLKSYELDFFEAMLGKKENKELFIKHQKYKIPEFSKYENIDINDITNKLKNSHQFVKQFYDEKKELSILNQKKNDMLLEYRYFKKLVSSQNIELKQINKCNLNNITLFFNEIISLKKITLFKKIKYIFFYKIGDFKFYNNSFDVILKSVQNKVYLNNLECIKNQIKEKEKFINENKKIEKDFIKYSMDYFIKYLSLKYNGERKIFSLKDIWNNCEKFLDEYPVILSTTYSSRNTTNNDFKFDYIIMDESSQIDVVTGTLALSSAKYAVIIGDEKQLPNVVSSSIYNKANIIFKEYNLDNGYSYSLNSFLSSVKNIIPNIEKKMLLEHYRCHPKIINFCNKKFYNNKLVIMTKDKGEDNVISVIKTKKGNHSRDNFNKRQVDIIKEILPTLDSNDVGIIAPYNNQVKLIKENVNNVEVNTIHKFQGREKDTIIISTVDDYISDFVGNENILNVAISRAKKHLILIVTGNEIHNKNIMDFINYVAYNNMEIINSKIYSVFDLLYKQNEQERLKFFKKHNRITKFDSENLIYYLIKKIIHDYEDLDFVFYQPLNDLINDKSLLSEKEYKYASHHNTHLDFYIYKKIGKTPVLAIEVDGYKEHKFGTKQYDRDLLKNKILEKYNIPLIRLSTIDSNEKIKIKEKIDKIMNE